MKIDTATWNKFFIGDLFEISRPVARSAKKYQEGTIPFVSTSNFNNGIVKYCIPEENEALDEGNCITISPLDGSAFYQPNDFLGRGGAGSSIIMLRNFNLNEHNGLFLASVIRTSLTRFSYSDQINKDSIKKEVIKLPTDGDGHPNWKFMDSYMKDIYKFSNNRIKALELFFVDWRSI